MKKDDEDNMTKQRNRVELFETIIPDDIKGRGGQSLMVFSHPYFGEEALKFYSEIVTGGIWLEINSARWLRRNKDDTGYEKYFGEVDIEELAVLVSKLKEKKVNGKTHFSFEGSQMYAESMTEKELFEKADAARKTRK